MSEKAAPTTKRDRTAVELLASLSLRSAPTAGVSFDQIAKFQAAFESDPKAQLAATVLSKGDILSALTSRQCAIQDQQGEWRVQAGAAELNRAVQSSTSSSRARETRW